MLPSYAAQYLREMSRLGRDWLLTPDSDMVTEFECKRILGLDEFEDTFEDVVIN